jgi:hypothetical protein
MSPPPIGISEEMRANENSSERSQNRSHIMLDFRLIPAQIAISFIELIFTNPFSRLILLLARDQILPQQSYNQNRD